MRKQRVLVCGASIAGPCVAYWLARAGYEVVVVEKAPAFRDGGQNIDVTGAARQVVERMGLTRQVAAANPHEVGLEFVDRRGEVVATFPKGTATSFTNELEILRGDLARIFYDATCGSVAYRFGTSVSTLTETTGGMHVVFADGSQDDFGLVICAEGQSSPTRGRVLGGRVRLRYIGLHTSYFRIPRRPSDGHWARWYSAPGRLVILTRPATPETESVAVTFVAPERGWEREPVQTQKQEVRRVLSGAGWESERIIDHLAGAEDFYFGPLTQVKASTWSRGRFVLLGDAAYAPTPIAGMGTTLAIVGAYVLAGELATRADPGAALRAYERILRPYVDRAQALPPGTTSLVYPSSRLGVSALNRVAAVAASGPVQWLVSKVSPGKKSEGDDVFELPEYPFR